jgi:phage tail-like protein
MRDVNGVNFALLANQTDWSGGTGMAWNGHAFSLAGQQAWRLPAPPLVRADALAARAASRALVRDEYGAVARIAADGLGVESRDAGTWVRLTDRDSTPLAPPAGHFVAIALAGARLALIAQDGANAALHLFDLRGRFLLASAQNPAQPLTLDAADLAPTVAVAPDGPMFVAVQGGIAIYEGGPTEIFAATDPTRFAPASPNPDPLRRTALLANRPGGAILAMTADVERLALLCDHGAAAQTLAVLDRSDGTWISAPITAIDATPLPYITDIALLPDAQIALMAPTTTTHAPCDCAVATLLPGQGIALAPVRYPMLDQAAPRFAATPGPDVFYLGGTPDAPEPRALLPLPYPAYLPIGALARLGLESDDPDRVWHRLYAEAYLPRGTTLTVWVRAAETPIDDADRDALLAAVLAAPVDTPRIGAASSMSASLQAALALAPLHRQPPLVPVSQPSELPFHPGLAAQAGMPGGLYEVLLQRSVGANRRLVGASLDLVAVASGDGRHSPCLRAIRIYAPRFCYQAEYLPALFHQTSIADEADSAPAAAPPDFRERLLANLEGLLTPIETRAAAAEMLLDPYAAPAPMLPWLASYLGRSIDAAWPEARARRAVAQAGRQLRARGTYRGVCLALDIATDGAVARGEIVLLETHRLRRTNATVLGIPLGNRNPLTRNGVASGNSIVGDTLILSAARARDVLALLAPSVVPPEDAAAVARFLDEYADRVQVVALLQGPNALAWRATVDAVLRAELPAQLRFDIIDATGRFVIGLSPLLDVDTFLDPPVPAAPLTLDRSVVGRDAVVRDPAALRQ